MAKPAEDGVRAPTVLGSVCERGLARKGLRDAFLDVSSDSRALDRT